VCESAQDGKPALDQQDEFEVWMDHLINIIIIIYILYICNVYFFVLTEAHTDVRRMTTKLTGAMDITAMRMTIMA
jgi:hypothetical protein